jgi:hypothetical protein
MLIKSILCCTWQACNGPGASWTWGARSRDLTRELTRELSSASGGAEEGGTRGVGPPLGLALGLGRSASATLRAAADLNVDAIKEKLLDHRIPESCV